MVSLQGSVCEASCGIRVGGITVAKPGNTGENEPSEQRTVSRHEQVDGSFGRTQPWWGVAGLVVDGSSQGGGAVAEVSGSGVSGVGDGGGSGVSGVGDGGSSGVSGVANDTSGGVSNSVLHVAALNGDGDIDGLVDGDGVGGDHGLGRVGGVCGVVHMGGLNDLLDGVNLVRGRHRDGPGHGNLVGSRHVLVDDHLTLNGNGDMDGHINVVLLDVDLGNDVGLLGSDPGVGPDGGQDPLLGHGVSGGGAPGHGCRGGGSDVGGGGGDDGSGQGTGLHQSLGGSGEVAVGRLGNDLLASGHVLVGTDDGGLAGLDHLVSHHPVLHPALHHRGAGGVRLVGLAHHRGGRDYRGSVGHGGTVSYSSGVAKVADSVADSVSKAGGGELGGAVGEGQEREGYLQGNDW